MKNTNFNHGKLGKEFPIKQHRWNTEDHPIHNQGPLKYTLATRVTYNEQKMIDGLCAIFQCDQREALRIAVYELSKIPSTLIEQYLPYAYLTNDKQHHSDPKNKLSFRLSKEEKESALEIAAIYNLSEKALVRLAFITIAKGIRNDKIKTISGCRKKTQKECLEAWRETAQPGGKSKLTALRQGHRKAYEAAAEAGREYDRKLYEQRGMTIEAMNAEGAMVRDHFCLDVVDTQMEIDELEFFRRLVNEDKTNRTNSQVLLDYFEGQYGEDNDLNLVLTESILESLMETSRQFTSKVEINLDEFLPTDEAVEKAKASYEERRKNQDNKQSEIMTSYLAWVDKSFPKD